MVTERMTGTYLLTYLQSRDAIPSKNQKHFYVVGIRVSQIEWVKGPLQLKKSLKFQLLVKQKRWHFIHKSNYKVFFSKFHLPLPYFIRKFYHLRWPLRGTLLDVIVSIRHLILFHKKGFWLDRSWALIIVIYNINTLSTFNSA